MSVVPGTATNTDGSATVGVLHAAIRMLELRLRNSTAPPWKIDMGAYMTHARQHERSVIRGVTSDVDNYKGSMSRADAELVVAMRRMAESQLALLRAAHEFALEWYDVADYDPSFDAEGPKSPWFAATLSLASALVNGVDEIHVAPEVWARRPL